MNGLVNNKDMKASELIKLLTERMEKHGDVEVRMLKGDRLRPIRYCTYEDYWNFLVIEEK